MLKTIAVNRSNPKAAPSMVQRLKSKQFTTTCHAMAVLGDGRVFKGHSQGFQTADGHAERSCINKICDIFNYNYVGKNAAQIRALFDTKTISFRYIYVDFQPCVDCDPWLETLIGTAVPVYYQEEFPYEEIKGSEFQKTYARFQKDLFGQNREDYKEEATRVAAQVEGLLAQEWQQFLQKIIGVLTNPVAGDLEKIQYNAKGEETLITNILADAGGASAVAAEVLGELIPLLGNTISRYTEPVDIVYDNTKTIQVSRISARVMQFLIDNNLWLAQYAGRYAIPAFG